MSRQVPQRLTPDAPAIPEVLDLIQRSFAFMEGRIDPPSSMHRLTAEAIAEQCTSGEVWTLGNPITACIFLTPKPDALYIGKLAVHTAQRGRGLARQLVTHAETRARDLGLPMLELETRIELTENHATFARLGFAITSEAAHEGYTRPTFVIMQKPL